MILAINEQIRIIIFSFFAGMLIGMLFDLYRFIRGFSSSIIILVIQDTLFWIFTAISTFVFLLYFDYAFLKGYIYLIICTGLIVYLITFSKKIFKIENLIAKNLYTIVRILAKHMRYLFRNIFIK